MSKNTGKLEAVSTDGKDVKEVRVPGIVQVILWGTFFSCLSVSIPHIAWLFHSYETGETETSVTLWVFSIDRLWLTSYAVAIGIDATIAALAYLLELGITGANKGMVWAFTIVLVVVSWYANYLYDKAHTPTGPIWTTNIAGHIPVGTITPVITAAMPAFVVAYTFIMQVIGDTKKVTSSALAEKATEIEAMATQQARIRKAKRQALVSSLTGLVDSAKEVVNHATGKEESTEEAVHPEPKETPVQTYNEQGRLDTIQFPGKDPVKVVRDTAGNYVTVEPLNPIPEQVAQQTFNTGPIQLPGYAEVSTNPQVQAVNVSSNGHNEIPVYRRKKQL